MHPEGTDALADELVVSAAGVDMRGDRGLSVCSFCFTTSA